MINRDELKNKLIAYADQEWKLPDNEEPYKLVNDMSDYIGDIDPYLRDNLIYEGLFNIIYRQKKLTIEQIKELTFKWTGDDYLFCGINETSDKVYTRTFTVLNLVALVAAGIEENALSKIEFLEVCDRVIDYMKRENDFRDYTKEKGWGHSVAHTGDLLGVLVESEYMDKEHIQQILEQIKRRATIATHGYIYNEDERQINAIEGILKLKLLTDEEIIAWIDSFDDYSKEGIFPDRFIENTNRKNFLRCLYFRFINNDYNKEFANTVKKVLDNMKGAVAKLE